jgi:CheY-like chemotaxis protein
MVLRVLIVEDTKERQEILVSLYKNHAWILVNTAARAIRMLQAYQFDIVSLDYNLDGELTGKAVAEAIPQSQNQNTRLIVHSMNPKGVTKIAELLPSAICYPVYRMTRTNQIFKTIRSRIDLLGADYGWDD